MNPAASRRAIETWIWALVLIYALLPLPALLLPVYLREPPLFFGFALWQMLPAFFAFVCLLRTVRDQRVLPDSQRVGRWILVVASACVCVGDLLFFGSQNGLIGPPTSDALQFWSRAPYMLGNALLFASLLALLMTERLEERVRVALDALLLTACGGLLLAYFAFLPLLRNATGVRPILAVYGAMSLAMLCLSLFVLGSSRSEPVVLRARALLCLALMMVCLSNSILLIAPVHDSFQWTCIGQYLWGIAMLLLGTSALQARSAQMRIGTNSLFQLARLMPAILPYGYLIVAIGLVAAGVSGFTTTTNANGIDAGAIWAGTSVLVLLALRQLVVTMQNVRVRNQLVQLNAQLDEMVALRTRQLHEQTAFVSRLNAATRDADVRAALIEGAPRLLFPHVYALWLADENDDLNLQTNAFAPDDARLQSIEPANHARDDKVLTLQPLQHGEHCFGWIGALWQGGHDDLDGKQLEFVAREAALALHNSHLLESALSDSERDSVTGLLNHRGVQNRMEEAFERAREENEPLAVAFMDLDRFKLFNDTYSPAVGDLVLKHIAAFLHDELQLPASSSFPLNGRSRNGHLRNGSSANGSSANGSSANGSSANGDACGTSNAKGWGQSEPAVEPSVAEFEREFRVEPTVIAPVAGRVGGDEFWMVLPGLDRASALRRVDELNANLQRAEFVLPGNEVGVPIAVSFGVAVFPDDATGLQRLISIAEAQLRGAKNSGLAVRSSTSMERLREELRHHDSFGALDAIVAAIDAKDAYTRAHSEEVTEYALELAEFLGLSDETFKILRTGAILHDVGKIAVPTEVLAKPGTLTPEEFGQMKTHPWIGAILVSALPGLGNVVDIVRSHHERYDGEGYPDKLRGEAIPMLARLLAVADAYSAMTCNRPYRRALDEAEALQRIEEGAGTQFDPQMARAWCEMRRAVGEQSVGSHQEVGESL